MQQRNLIPTFQRSGNLFLIFLPDTDIPANMLLIPGPGITGGNRLIKC